MSFKDINFTLLILTLNTKSTNGLHNNSTIISIFFAIYDNLYFKKHLSFPHSLHKSFSDCFPRLFKIPNTRSSPAFLPIQFKLMEGQRYNLKYKMTNHVYEFQIHIYSCIWLWICITDLKCSSNKMKCHYENLTKVK